MHYILSAVLMNDILNAVLMNDILNAVLMDYILNAALDTIFSFGIQFVVRLFDFGFGVYRHRLADRRIVESVHKTGKPIASTLIRMQPH